MGLLSPLSCGIDDASQALEEECSYRRIYGCDEFAVRHRLFAITWEPDLQCLDRSAFSKLPFEMLLLVDITGCPLAVIS